MRQIGASMLLQQLAYQAPMLLAYLVGLIVALMFLARTRLPSILVLIATSSLLFASIATTAAQGYLFNVGLTATQISHAMVVVGIVGICIRVAAFGLLLTAVFVQRGGAGEAFKPPQFGLRAM